MTKIYYFSATGNTLAIARDIAKEMSHTTILPIVGTEIQKPVGGNGESIGFVFPVYFNGLPGLVRRFAQSLMLASDTYCFAVADSGGTRSNVLGELDDILLSKNLHLSYADEIQMPSNYVIAHSPPARDQIEKLIAKASGKTKQIAKAVSHQALKPAKRQAQLWSKIVNDHFLYKNADKWDEKFWVTEKCIGCGLCASLCPVGNIELKNSHPSWQHHCEKCLACIHWCPNGAVEYGRSTIGRTRYHHPGIQAADLITRHL